MTNAWEKLVSALQQGIWKWRANSSAHHEDSSVTRQTVIYHGFPYRLAMFINQNSDNLLYQSIDKHANHALPDGIRILLHDQYDFDGSAHHLSKWFGCNQFVVMAAEDESPLSASECALLRSAFAIAMDKERENGNTCVPFFIPEGHRENGVYTGYYREGSYEVFFRSNLYDKIPDSCHDFSGLFNTFLLLLGVDDLEKEGRIRKLAFGGKITYNRVIAPDDTHCARIRDALTKVPPLRFHLIRYGDVQAPYTDVRIVHHYPLKSIAVEQLQRYYGIPLYPDGLANRSSLRFHEGPRAPQRFTPFLLQSFTLFDQLKSVQRMVELLPAVDPGQQNLLASTITKLQDTLERTPSKVQLEQMMHIVFEEGLDVEDQGGNWFGKLLSTHGVAYHQLQLKACPPGAIPSVLGLKMLEWKNPKAIAIIWKEFVRKLHDLWLHEDRIPFLTCDPPIDYRSCLLYQKIQLLQFCMNRRNELAEAIIEESTQVREVSSLSLLKSGHPLHIPRTQTMGVMTEDILLQQETMLSEMGVDDGGQRQRMLAQSDSLLSDMQCFKSANEGAVLEDFIRWYSPSDWVEGSAADFEEAQVQVAPKKIMRYELGPDNYGWLSQRMRLENNLWKSTWDEANAVPVQDQKLLFDYEGTAAEIFQWLEDIVPADAIQQLIYCTLCQAAFTFDSIAKALESEAIQIEIKHLKTILNQLNHHGLVDRVRDDLVAVFMKIENLLSKASLIVQTLPIISPSTLDEMLATNTCELSDPNACTVMRNIIQTEGYAIYSREYLFKAKCRGDHNSTLPYRLYASSMDNGMRIATVRTQYIK